MRQSLSAVLAVSALSLAAAVSPAKAAFLFIDDTSPSDVITFNVNDFEGGFSVNGSQIQSGLGHPVSVSFPELVSGSPVTYSFDGSWIDLGQTTPVTATVAFVDPGVTVGASDILTYTYSTAGGSGSLTGTVTSDGNVSGLPIPPGARVITEPPGRFDFSNAFITAQFQSDVAVPEPASLALFGAALVGIGALRRRRG